MVVRRSIAALGISIIAAAQTVPEGWKIVREKDMCQVAMPSGWKPGLFPSIIEDPRQTVSLVLENENTETFRVMDTAMLGYQNPAKVVENSTKRIYLESKPSTILNKTSVTWNIWIPAKKGTCHLVLTLQNGADLAAARKVAATLEAIK